MEKMLKRVLLLLASSLVVISSARAQEASIQSKLVGRWIVQGPSKGSGATMNITSVDSATGQLRGKYIPPSGPAGGKEFDVTGWVSSAPPREKFDNVVALSFSVSLTTYGSIASWTGYLKDNKIIAMWLNVRPNSPYDWDHITTNQDVFVKSP